MNMSVLLHVILLAGVGIILLFTHRIWTKRLIVQREQLKAEAGKRTAELQQEIAERQRMTEALRGSEERYRAFSELTSDFAFVFHLEPDGTLVEEWLSDSFYRITGVTPEEAREKGWIGLIHPEDRPVVVEDMKAVFSGQTGKGELRILTKNQQARWLYVYSHPVWDEKQGRVVRVYGAAQDITERKQTEKALRESESKAKVLLDAIPDMMFRLNREGIFLDYKAAPEDLYVDPEETIIGRQITELIPAKFVEQARHYINVALDTGETQVIEYQLPIHERGIRDYEARIVVSGSEEVMAIIRDITKRKQSEEALKSARKEAERANRAKSVFLANMSHELRTPLNAILGYAQILLRHGGFTEKQRDELSTIYHSGEHLLMMINEILDFSKIEAQKIEMEPVEFFFPAFVKSLIGMMQVQADQKGIKFMPKICTEIPDVVIGDEKRLRQVLLNLISNAVKFTEEGEVVFQIEVCHDDSKQDLENNGRVKILFQVDDQGIGISPEDMKGIFQPFQQLGDKRFYSQGIGLGLAISRRFVRLMGSELHVKSMPGQGSSFWFELELGLGTGATPGEKKPLLRIIGFKPLETSRKGTEIKKTLKVLIADDSVENRVVLRDMLVPLGFDIIEAVDGQETLELAKVYHPALILMDLMMPVMDGFKATRQIRQLSELENVIIIGVSASISEQVYQESIRAGCQDFLEKPIAEEKLLERLEEYLDIEWLYETGTPFTEYGVKEGTGSTENRMSEENGICRGESILPPPKEELFVLYELAKSGDIAGLRERVAHLAATESEFAPFVTRLHYFTRTFQMNRIKKFLELYMYSEI